MFPVESGIKQRVKLLCQAAIILGGQEIISDPPFYDPQLPASRRPGGLEVQEGRGRIGGQKNGTTMGTTLWQHCRWEKLGLNSGRRRRNEVRHRR